MALGDRGGPGPQPSTWQGAEVRAVPEMNEVIAAILEGMSRAGYSEREQFGVRLSLEEDVGSGDLTTNAIVPPDASGSAFFLAKQPLVICGHGPAAEVFGQLGGTYTPLLAEGEVVDDGPWDDVAARAEQRGWLPS